MSAKKSPIKKVEAPAPEVIQPEIDQEVPAISPEAVTTPEPEVKVEPPPKPKPLTMVGLKAEIDELRQIIQDIQSLLVLKRKPTNNSKIQIRDKQTGKLYKSKNNVYQSMLRAGDLKDLVAKGIFGDIPEKNNFGWFALQRQFPDRFEEVNANTEET
jgi:hypothetical protein